MRRQEFERNLALELGVLGLVEDAHLALAELVEDLVVADRGADQDASILPLGSCGSDS